MPIFRKLFTKKEMERIIKQVGIVKIRSRYLPACCFLEKIQIFDRLLFIEMRTVDGIKKFRKLFFTYNEVFYELYVYGEVC